MKKTVFPAKFCRWLRVGMGMRCRGYVEPDCQKSIFPEVNGAGHGILAFPEKEECILAHASLADLIQEVLGCGSCIRLRSKGFSMDPFVKDEDILALAPMPVDGPEVGDIVAYRIPGENGRLVIHRVIKKTVDSCVLKGDCCSESDGIVSKKSILGRVRRIERDGHSTTFSLGPEGKLIAYLSGKNILWPLGKIFFKKIFWRLLAE